MTGFLILPQVALRHIWHVYGVIENVPISHGTVSYRFYPPCPVCPVYVRFEGPQVAEEFQST